LSLLVLDPSSNITTVSVCLPLFQSPSNPIYSMVSVSILLPHWYLMTKIKRRYHLLLKWMLFIVMILSSLFLHDKRMFDCFTHSNTFTLSNRRVQYTRKYFPYQSMTSFAEDDDTSNFEDSTNSKNCCRDIWWNIVVVWVTVFVLVVLYIYIYLYLVVVVVVDNNDKQSFICWVVMHPDIPNRWCFHTGVYMTIVPGFGCWSFVVLSLILLLSTFFIFWYCWYYLDDDCCIDHAILTNGTIPWGWQASI
jgi:hypothetical protein